MSRGSHCGDTVAEAALGALEAQRALDVQRSMRASGEAKAGSDVVVLSYLDIAGRFGAMSAASMEFVRELAKRASAHG